MNIADIPSWLETTRAAAEVQAERWQGVDPSRLLEACDLVAQLLALQPASPSVLHPVPPSMPVVGVDTGWRVVEDQNGYARFLRIEEVGPSDTVVRVAREFSFEGDVGIVRHIRLTPPDRFVDVACERAVLQQSRGGRNEEAIENGVPLRLLRLGARGIGVVQGSPYYEVELTALLKASPRDLIRHLGSDVLLIPAP